MISLKLYWSFLLSATCISCISRTDMYCVLKSLTLSVFLCVSVQTYVCVFGLTSRCGLMWEDGDGSSWTKHPSYPHWPRKGLKLKCFSWCVWAHVSANIHLSCTPTFLRICRRGCIFAHFQQLCVLSCVSQYLKTAQLYVVCVVRAQMCCSIPKLQTC